MQSDRRLEWLEVMRGVAALWVLVHHAGQSVNHFIGSIGYQPWIERGFWGVDFFFVLSGFIIAFSAQRLVDRQGGVKEYATARLTRIYVPYLPVGVAMLLFYWIWPDLSKGGRDVSVLSSLLLAPDNLPPALSVAWTLVHEMIFYFIYALWFINRTMFRFVLVLWVASILFIALAGSELSRLQSYFFSPLNLYFVSGVVAFHVTRVVKFGTTITSVLAVIGICLLAFQVVAIQPDRIVTGVAFFLLVLAAVSPLAARLRVWSPLVALGAASYAIYLVHNPVLSVLARLAERLIPGVGPSMALVILASLALAAGLLYWYGFERPMLKWVRGKVRGTRLNAGAKA